jgi:hypothetical protein
MTNLIEALPKCERAHHRWVEVVLFPVGDGLIPSGMGGEHIEQPKGPVSDGPVQVTSRC